MSSPSTELQPLTSGACTASACPGFSWARKFRLFLWLWLLKARATAPARVRLHVAKNCATSADGLSAEQPGAWPGETCWGQRARWGEMGGASIGELSKEGFWRKAQISWDFLDISGWVSPHHLPPQALQRAGSCSWLDFRQAAVHANMRFSVYNAQLSQQRPSSPLLPSLYFSLLSKARSNWVKTAFSKVFATLVANMSHQLEPLFPHVIKIKSTSIQYLQRAHSHVRESVSGGGLVYCFQVWPVPKLLQSFVLQCLLQ